MGRKRLNQANKKVPFNASITSEVIEQFKKECEERGEIPSNIIEELIKKYLLEKK